MKQHEKATGRTVYNEEGQSIVLIALIIIGLLAFVGLATDAGFLFARSSQFSSSVDAAALAGVIDLDPAVSNLDAPDARSMQFLAANGWPTSTMSSFASSTSLTAQGIPQYSITVTWPVETFFLRVLGFETVPITRTATAVYFAQSEIYVPTAFDRGQISKASQFIFGPDACTANGDPVVPDHSTSMSDPNVDPAHIEGIYRYRIRIPETYTPTVLRVELFDPDSYNLNGSNSATVQHTLSYNGGMPSASPISCMSPGGSGLDCPINTGESLLAANQNPLWLLRVDENWSGCDPNFGDPSGNTITNYQLYYLDEDGERENLSTYRAQNIPETDMNWVVPGQTSGVDVEAGSQSTFDINLGSFAIPTIDGARYVYMDVSAETGSAKNVWDVRAGPPPGFYTSSLPTGVNARNVTLANDPANYKPAGVDVYAVGRMPLHHYWGNRQIKIPVAPVEARQGGGTIYTSVFDYDMSAPKTVTFTIDSMAPGAYRIPIQLVPSDPDPLVFETTCSDGTTCNNSWMLPQIRLGIPTDGFFGGNLEATYRPKEDSHTWYMAITSGRPFLTR